MKSNNYEEIVRFCRENRAAIETASPVELKKIQRDNEFSLNNFIKVLQAFGIHHLDPQTQKEHNDIFGTGDGFGGHIYGDNQRIE